MATGPAKGWYSVEHAPLPEDSYRLELGGLVARPLRLPLAELQAPTGMATLGCTGGLYSRQRCSGLRFARLLERAARSPDNYECTYEARWGPTAYFDSVEPPPPTGCTRAAADYVKDALLLPYAKRHFRRYYRGITGWSLTKRLCRDLDGDGDREMAVLLNCCTGGSIGPWAIFKHRADRQWRIAYAQIREPTWRLQIRGRTVRGLTPAPYEGVCTHYTRWREVRWNGHRWRSRLSARHRVRGLPRVCG